MRRYMRAVWGLGLLGLGVALAGCTPKLRLVPVPVEKPGPDSTQVRLFDFDGDGKAEYREVLGPSGQVRLHEFDRDGDGAYERVVDRAKLDANKTRHVLLFLDGVPHSLFAEMWDRGHFRLFSRPGRMVSTFPALTDPAHSLIFHDGPPYGYEAAFYDRVAGRQTRGVDFYLSGKNEEWVEGVDHRIGFVEDAVMYLFPGGVFKREMHSSRRVLDRSGEDRVVLYLLSPDGICHMFPRQRAEEHFALFDRWIEQMVYDAGGELHVTMISDHGNNFAGCGYVPIREALRRAGLRVGHTLKRSGDVVAPQFGLVSFASVFCYSDVERRRAVAAILALEGVDAIAWREAGGVAVINRHGSATIHRRIEGERAMFAYRPVDGDPLALRGALEDLKAAGAVDVEGFAADAAWFDATKGGPMPDVLRRLHASLYTNVLNPADIVVSLADGYYYGDRSWENWVKLRGTHGGLSRESTLGLFMSTALAAPDYVRCEQILPVINQHFDWTPTIPWVDYAWLASYRAMQGAPADRKAGGAMWPTDVRAPTTAPATQATRD